MFSSRGGNDGVLECLGASDKAGSSFSRGGNLTFEDFPDIFHTCPIAYAYNLKQINPLTKESIDELEPILLRYQNIGSSGPKTSGVRNKDPPLFLLLKAISVQRE